MTGWTHSLRLQAPLGVLLLYLPCLWGLALSPQDLWPAYAIFGVGAFWARSLGCLYNDVVDAPLDINVARTRHRPLASGLLSRKRAGGLLPFLSLSGLPFLYLLPVKASVLSFVGMAFSLFYPFAKRVMAYPQVILALAFNMGVFVAAAYTGAALSGRALWMVWLGGVVFTLEYDTIYAFQDVKDDRVHGIGSLAVVLGSHAKEALLGLALIRHFCWTLVAPEAYLLMTLLFAVQAYRLLLLDLGHPPACHRLFRDMAWIGVIFALILKGPSFCVPQNLRQDPFYPKLSEYASELSSGYLSASSRPFACL